LALPHMILWVSIVFTSFIDTHQICIEGIENIGMEVVGNIRNHMKVKHSFDNSGFEDMDSPDYKNHR